jgi:hypothetical protein
MLKTTNDSGMFESPYWLGLYSISNAVEQGREEVQGLGVLCSQRSNLFAASLGHGGAGHGILEEYNMKGDQEDRADLSRS